MSTWVIRHMQHLHMLWSNPQKRWVKDGQHTRYTDSGKKKAHLPPGGCWAIERSYIVERV